MNGTALNNVNVGVNLVIFALGTGTAVITPLMQYESYTDQLPNSVVDYQPIPANSWEDALLSSERVGKYNLEDTIMNFSGNLLCNTQDIDENILEVVNDNFWDLL